MQLPRKPNGDCVHLQSGRCGIYDRRPASCRGYDCRLYLLGFPVHVDQVNLLEQVDAMWGDWRLETPEDVDAMFAWQRAFSETMQVAAARRLDKQEMEASILTLLLRYLGSAHEVREQIGLPQARKLAQHQSDVIRDGVLRSVIASVRDAPAQAAE